MGNQKKYLVVRLGALGDIIHTLPAQQVLHQVDPECSIHWLTEAAYADLLKCVPGIERLWIVDTRKWRSNPQFAVKLLRVIAALRKEEFEAAIDFQGLLKSAILTRLARAHQRIGFAEHQIRERAAARFYSDSTTIVCEGRHRIEQSVQLLSAIRGFDGSALQGKVVAHVPLRIPDSCRRYVKEQLSKFSIVGAPVILSPGAGWPTKTWPVSRFTELSHLIVKKLGRPVVVAWGPGEEELAREVTGKDSSGQVVDFPTGILELAELCRQSSLIVAGDTGPLHLAVAVGTPAVAIMGPTYGWRNGPFNPKDEIVTHERPCPNPYKRRCKDHFCMDIPVDRVFQAVERRFSSTAGASPPEQPGT